MFDKKTVLVCSALILAGGLAVPKFFPLAFLIFATAVVSIVMLPIIRFFMTFCWNFFFKGISDKITSKNGKALFNLMFAPPKN